MYLNRSGQLETSTQEQCKQQLAIEPATLPKLARREQAALRYWQLISNMYFPPSKSDQLISYPLPINTTNPPQTIVDSLLRQALHPDYLAKAVKQGYLQQTVTLNILIDEKAGCQHIHNRIGLISRDPARFEFAQEYIQEIVQDLCSGVFPVEQHIGMLQEKLDQLSYQNQQTLCRYQLLSNGLHARDTIRYQKIHCQNVLNQIQINNQIESIVLAEGPFTSHHRRYYKLHFQKALLRRPVIITCIGSSQYKKPHHSSIHHYYAHKFTSCNPKSFANLSIMQVTRQSVYNSVKTLSCHHCLSLLSHRQLYLCGHGDQVLHKRWYKSQLLSCGRFYCASCVRLYYDTMGRSCPFCQGECYCPRCRRVVIGRKIIRYFMRITEETSDD